MKYLNIYENNECIAEVWGEVTVSKRNCVISTNPEERTKVLRLVSKISNSMFCAGKLTVPVESIHYMSNQSSNVKPGIRFIKED